MAEAAQQKAEEIMSLDETKLIGILGDPRATEFAKAKACQRLAVIGTKEAVPALAQMLADPKFAHYARFGLEPIPDASVDDALRLALGWLSGKARVGVINSIGQRRDAKAVETLARHLDDPDAAIAAAAAAALGRISGPKAAKELQKVLDYTRSVTGACLECCDGLLAQGRKEEARELYDALLRRSDLPAAVRQAAERGREASSR